MPYHTPGVNNNLINDEGRDVGPHHNTKPAKASEKIMMRDDA